MENTNLNEMNLNESLETLNSFEEPIMVVAEKEVKDIDPKLVIAGAAVVGLATLYLARKPIKKAAKATKEGFKELKSKFSKAKEEEVVDVECEEIEE